jgi:hypothetical protein
MSTNPASSTPGPYLDFKAEVSDISLSIRDLMDRIDANWELNAEMKEDLRKELMLTVCSG